MSDTNGYRVAWGDRGVGSPTNLRIAKRFKFRPELWDKPCPPTWKPNLYLDIRRRMRELAATGTDD